MALSPVLSPNCQVMMSVSSGDSESNGASMGKGSFSSENLPLPKLKSQNTLRCGLQLLKTYFWACLLILVSVIIILTSLLTGLLVHISKDLNYSSLCQTVDCIKAASDMLTSIDQRINPCDDFYEFSCGGWMRSNSIQDDESRTDTYSVMRNELSEKLKSLLESPITPEDSEAIQKAKHFYSSCINLEQIEKRGALPLVKLLKDEFGGWPLIDEENSNIDWITIMAKLRRYNNEILIGHNVGPHDTNSSLHLIKIYPATLGMSSADYYLNKTSKQFLSYKRMVKRIADLLGAPNKTAETDIDELLEFEIKLANITGIYEKVGGAAYQRMPLFKLVKMVPKLSWVKYFEYAIPSPINETEIIGVYGFDHFLDIQELLENTTTRVLKNYLLWRFIMNRASNLDSRFENALEDYYRDQYGTQSVPARWKKCVDFANANLGIAVSALYVRKHFDIESKLKAEDMIKNIKREFNLILDEIEWMDAETRQDAKTKAEMMEEHIGFPEYILDPKLLDKDYEHLFFNESNYFENVIGYLKNSTKKSQSKLNTLDDRTKWTVMPSVVNAQYHRYRNLMSFPAAILQSPLFNKNYPPALNYGAIGSVIGHELTHGFDSNGRHHDQFGNQRLWWHPNTIERFIKKSSCMVQQYGNYTVTINGEQLNANGQITLGENIADNGGIKQSYRAFKKLIAKGESSLRLRLPGLNMTQDQMFFLKYAQSWCQIITDEGKGNAIKTWRHSLGRFRVIGTLSNSNSFSKAFNCQLGSPMNPHNKCEVW